MSLGLQLSDYEFDLPEELIAQYPADERDSSRLLFLGRKSGSLRDENFLAIEKHFVPGDCLVFNNTRVIPARLFFRRTTGSLCEFVLVRRIDDFRWKAISNRSARLRIGETLCCEADNSVKITLESRDGEFFIIVSDPPFDEKLLTSVGRIPLPPYITRTDIDSDAERYQTVYAERPGAVAAPTAGLHFTPGIIDSLREKGVETAFVTLEVSWGTFQPVRSENIDDHIMHSERFDLSEESAEKVNRCRVNGGRIISVGTTSLRVLESRYQNGLVCPGSGDTDIFIRPPAVVRSIDGLITNFHTPRSTLLMLVSAFAGYDTIMRAYKHAISERYRFFSYGDAMLIL